MKLSGADNASKLSTWPSNDLSSNANPFARQPQFSGIHSLTFLYFFPHAFMSHASVSTLTVHCNSTYILYFYSLAWLRLQKTDSQYETSLFTQEYLQHMKAVHGIMEQKSRFHLFKCNWMYGYIKHFFLICFCQINSQIKDVCMLETVLMVCLFHPTVFSIFHPNYTLIAQLLT